MSKPNRPDDEHTELFRLASLIGCEPEEEARHRKKLLEFIAAHTEAACREAKTPLIKSYEAKVEDLQRETLKVSAILRWAERSPKGKANGYVGEFGGGYDQAQADVQKLQAHLTSERGGGESEAAAKDSEK